MTQTEYTYDIFISYSHADKQWVHNWLLPKLEDAGLAVCIDVRDFEIGVPSIVNMENAVTRSRHVVLVLTPDWINSEWANFEALLVQSDDPAGINRRTLPIMLRQCKLPARLKILTYADFTDTSSWEMQLQRILTSIKNARGETQTTPRPEPPPAVSSRVSSDPFERYRHGLEQLKNHIGQHDDLLLFEQQLLENMQDARRFGDTEQSRSNRARIVSRLNHLALETIGVSFNELCSL